MRADRAAGRKKKASPIAILIMIVCIVFIVLVASWYFKKYSYSSDEMASADYFGLAENEVALVVDDEVLEARGTVIDGNVYIDFPTAWNHFNSRFFWEETSGAMLLTLPDGTQRFTADDGTGSLVMVGDVPYLSVDCIAEHSDIDLAVYEDPHRVVARTHWDDVQTATTTSDAKIRYRGGPKSDIIKEVPAGTVVSLIEQHENWSGVATDDGYVGYLRNGEIEVAETVGIAHEADASLVFPKLLREQQIVMGWQYLSQKGDVEALKERIAASPGLNVISPTWYRPDGMTGKVKSLADPAYVEAAHAAGVEVWPHVSDMESEGLSIGELLANGETRASLIADLVDQTAGAGADGINIDFEKISEETAPQFLQFLRELVIAAHAKELVISVDNYVPIFTPHYKRAEQAACADYIVIMNYDEYSARSSEAGPVASLPYVKQGIEDTLAEVPKEQVINAVPLYTRGWTEPFGNATPSCETLGMEEADAFARDHGIEVSYDETYGQRWGSAEDNTARYSIWLEDETALTKKMELIEQYELAGVAFWRLGYDRPAVWDIVTGNVQEAD